MAAPKVFISSTCFDLSEIREQLSRFVEGYGFEPILSEHGDVFYHPDLHTHEACVHEVKNCQLFILIIGGRFGGEYVIDKSKSITNAEYIAARNNKIPVFTYIRENVLADHNVYQKNRKKKFAAEIDYPAIEKQEHAIDIFNFIDDVRRSSINNAFEGFKNYQHIESHLRKQWAGFFYELLRSREVKAQIDVTNHLIEGVSASSRKLEELVKTLYKSTSKDEAAAEKEIASIEALSATKQFYSKVFTPLESIYITPSLKEIKKIASIQPRETTWSDYLIKTRLFDLDADRKCIHANFAPSSIIYSIDLDSSYFDELYRNGPCNSTEAQRLSILMEVCNKDPKVTIDDI